MQIYQESMNSIKIYQNPIKSMKSMGNQAWDVRSCNLTNLARTSGLFVKGHPAPSNPVSDPGPQESMKSIQIYQNHVKSMKSIENRPWDLRSCLLTNLARTSGLFVSRPPGPCPDPGPQESMKSIQIYQNLRLSQCDPN